MNSRRQILICDDEQHVEHHWKQQLENLEVINESFDVNVLLPHDLLNASKALENRRRKARQGQQDEFPQDEATVIDKTDILVVDYDLLDLDGHEYYQTGEGIAYLARCYSDCGLIVALNQYDKGVTFDLSLDSKGFPESYADLNISSNLLGSPGLWSEPWNGFRPWYWPLLPQALEKFKERCRNLEGNTNKRILEFLEFPPQIIDLLPTESIEQIGGQDATFEEFVCKSGRGLNLKDAPLTKRSIIKVAASRIWQWLEWGILPPQNLLIDAPHLISALPSLVKERSLDIDTWNKTASIASEALLPLTLETIESFRFAQTSWLSRPVWFWHLLKDYNEIQDVADPWSTEWPDHVFCEDTSRFVVEEKAREFTSAVNSQFSRRYVEFLSEEVTYQNRTRLYL